MRPPPTITTAATTSAAIITLVERLGPLGGTVTNSDDVTAAAFGTVTPYAGVGTDSVGGAAEGVPPTTGGPVSPNCGGRTASDVVSSGPWLAPAA